MSERFEKALQDLNKQKEDIELLLTSLEDAYAEATITEKHYKELRTKNKKKLDEIAKKIETVKGRQEKTEEREAKEKEKKPKPEIKEEPEEKPKEETKEETPKEEPKVEPKKEEPPETPEEEKPKEAAETPPEEPEVPMGTPEPSETDKKKITEEDFKRIMTKVFENAKLIDLAEITPRMEKMTAELEKMKAFIDAVREQKNTDTDRSSRINEELGELRSGFHGNEGRLSEMEMKVKEHDTTLGDLKPQRYSRAVQKLDRSLKMAEGRLDKHDDLTSMIMKRISGIKDVLEQFGSMEQIARMNKEISKKLISIDEREKRIKRISDKLDGIFSELNKRLDEFIFYKAKQDSVGELVDELLRNIDEMGTKIEKFAEKADLELLRESLEGKIAAAGPAKAGMSEEEQKLQSQKEEINDLLSILEEQHNKKTIPDKEYEKAKAENTKRIQDIDEKIAALIASPPEAAAGPVTGPASTPPETPEEEKPKEEEEKPVEVEPEPGPLKEEPKEETKEKPKPGKTPKEEPLEEPPEETKEEPKVEPKKEEPQKEPKPGKTPKAKNPAKGRATMLETLEESFKKGLITKDTFEKTKKVLEKTEG
jgi:predicted  nucleic acid-binding Zn-ribbon protein